VSLNDIILARVKKTGWKAPWAAGGAVAAVVGGALILTDSPHGSRNCESNPLRHVYSPQRLTVLKKCVTEKVTVIAYRHEQDSDWHVNVLPDNGRLINGQNIRRQHGLLVLEWVPGDSKPDHFFCGQRLEVTGTYVLDRQHGGWAEIHPVMKWSEETAGSCTKATKDAKNLVPPTEEK
jgi:hypothetical protein